MRRTFMLAGALAGFVGVALGAFAAHGLRGRLSPDMLAVFETGVRYQMYHALALMLTSALSTRSTMSTASIPSTGAIVHGRAAAAAGWLFVAGIVLFSGSLYVLAVTGIAVLGAITPLGGVAFLLGWACLAIATL
jgi:uncharacterized membrane protein YgdD (TMEM256/DUF423 family)